MQRPGLPSDFYNLRTIFEEELTKVSKQDPRDLLRKPGQLATQIRQQVQSEAKKINSVIKLNTWNAERQVAKLELDVMDRFLKFPLKLDDKRQRARIITVKGFDVIGDNIPELIKNNGKRRGQFKFTKQILDTEFDVMVIEKAKKRTMEGDREGRLLQFLQLRTNILGLPPEQSEKVEPLVKAIGEIMELREEEVDPQDDIIVRSPREEGLEALALGIEPIIDPNMTKEELLDLRIEWLDFKGTELYKGLESQVKRGIEDLIDKVEEALLAPPEQVEQPGAVQQEGQEQQIPGASPQLLNTAALAGGPMQSSKVPNV